MTEEISRARKAVEEAQSGKNVAVISSGDSGVYGMATLILRFSRSVGRRRFSFHTDIPGKL